MAVFRRALIFFTALLQGVALGAAVLKVPSECPTIKAAVRSARSGDTVEVADGIYFEKNVILDKDIIVRSAHLYGAFIYGTGSSEESLFVVRSKVEISGFVLLNSQRGILQRDSPDVAWRGHDLWILNMEQAGVSIDDKWANVGSADLDNLIITHCGHGIRSNDAGEIRVRRSILANCRRAFAGSNHRRFSVERCAVWNCGRNVDEDLSATATPNSGYAFVLEDLVDFDLDKAEAGRPALERRLLGFLDSGREPYRGAGADAKRRAAISCLIGETCFAKGEMDPSAAGFDAAISLGRTTGFRFIVARALGGRSIIQSRRGRTEAALDDLKAAVGEIDAIYRGIPFKLFQTEFFADKIGVYDNLLSAYLEIDRRDPSRGFAREALRCADRLKAGGLSDRILAAAGVGPPLAIAGAEDPAKALRREIGSLQASLVRADLSVGRRRKILEQLEDVEDEYKSRLIHSGRMGPPRGQGDAGREGDFIGDFEPDPDTAVIEYFLGDKSAFLFCATRDGVTMSRLGDRTALESAVVGYLDFLTLEGNGAFAAKSGGRRLFDMLLGPVAAKLAVGIRRIVIVPDGALAMLPFEALVRPGAGFLIEDYDISYVPSIRCRELIARRRRAADPRLDLFLYAYAGQDGRPLFLSASRRSVSRLAYVDREARAVASRFAEGRSVVLGGGRRGPVPGLSAVADARIVHFAVHGYFDHDRWWRSALLIEPGAFGFPEGLLQPLDIIGFPLEADLVVLSACQTGSGRLESGEGPMGFASAFLAAGARSVISSFWSIPDRSAAVFMERFYERWTRGGDVQAALREAKIDMLKSGYAHPRHWAAFVLAGIGDARSTGR